MINCGGGSEWWIAAFGFLGVLAGGLISIGTAVLTDWLKNRRATKLERFREDALRARFARSNSVWVPMDKLKDSIGCDRETTVRHLLMIGARRSMKEADSWGLLANVDKSQDSDT